MFDIMCQGQLIEVKDCIEIGRATKAGGLEWKTSSGMGLQQQLVHQARTQAHLPRRPSITTSASLMMGSSTGAPASAPAGKEVLAAYAGADEGAPAREEAAPEEEDAEEVEGRRRWLVALEDTEARAGAPCRPSVVNAPKPLASRVRRSMSRCCLPAGGAGEADGRA